MSLQKLLYFSIIFLFSINISSSQCGIESPVIDNIECIENSTYKFDLNFTITDNSIDSFDVYSNGTIINRYGKNQLPVTITNNIYSSKDTDSISIVDFKTNCSVSLEVNNPCECTIYDTKYSKINCTDDSFSILLDFKHLKVSDTFDIGYIDKNLGVHLYADLPKPIGTFANFDTTYSLFIADRNSIFCYTEVLVSGGNCAHCSISNINLVSYECNDDYNKNIIFSFEHTNSGALGYDIYINGEKYSTKQFDNSTVIDSLTLREEFEIGPLNIECDSILNIKIVDIENPDCFAQNSFNSFCCELCEIGEINIRDIECKSNSTFDFILDFDYARNRKDSFSLNINGYELKVSLAILPLQFKNNPISNNTPYQISVCLDQDKCCNSTEFDPPDCDYFDCSISGIVYSTVYDSISQYWINFNEIVHSNTSDSFELRGNGINYGIFAYTDLPVKLDAYNCSDSLNLEYIFSDINVEDCKYVIEPGIVDCPNKVSTNNTISHENWILYGNSNYIYIHSNSFAFKNASISIYDVLGNKVYSSVLTDGDNFFKKEIKSLRTGLYVMHFKNNGFALTKKLYIQK